jgi:DNA mismatch endonuclease Vsr
LRWKLVGNAVSVPVAKWLGGRLAEPGHRFEDSWAQPIAKNRSWPRAAWNCGGGRFGFEIGTWPVAYERSPLRLNRCPSARQQGFSSDCRGATSSGPNGSTTGLLHTCGACNRLGTVTKPTVPKRSDRGRRAARQRLPRPTTDPATSLRLARIRRHGTRPEMEIRRLLHASGVRYRTSNRDLPGSPDLANRVRRWAIFVHGCFWHGHDGCRRATIPKRNRGFWVEKFAANRKRDRRKTAELQALGYRVFTVWECEIAPRSNATQHLLGAILESSGTSRRNTGRPSRSLKRGVPAPAVARSL